MTPEQFHSLRRFTPTPSGEIAWVAQGQGPAAVFLHGFPLNGFQWRYQLTGLADLRRCIAPDLLGLGHTRLATADQDVSFRAQARMLGEWLDALELAEVDLVANDSGGAVAQIFAAHNPQRVRSLVLTNCDVDENSPPQAFMPTVELARQGQLGELLAVALANPEAARAPTGLGVGFEFPERLSDEVLATYLAPITADGERKRAVDRYVASMSPDQTVEIRERLAKLAAPTLIVWGLADIFFARTWADWLARTVPGVRRVVELEGAKLFFPEERAEPLCALIREHWDARAGAAAR
jgi:pimeloyl-ACP methyl ester carboxylesterase